MTSNSEVSLKSWLRTLRFSIEYYEDTFESKDNWSSENNHRAKNMLDGGDSDDSDDSNYVNIWDCSHSKKSSRRFKNSLESVENISVVSNLESENFNASSTTDLSNSSEGRRSVSTTSQRSRKNSHLDDEIINRNTYKVKKKPVATPRQNKHLNDNEPVYMNLPLISQDKSESSQLHNSETNSSKYQEYMNIYENLPPKASAIYENLPLDPCSAKKSACSSMDSLKYEDEFFQTMQYFEDTIGTVAICSEESDCEDAKSIGRFESSYSSVDSNFEDSTSFNNAINDKKFTDSSSSFEEYQDKNQLPKIQNTVQPETLIQRFAKESRVSAFIEELEPSASQEFKDIPAPKSKIIVFDRAKRFSVPLQFVVAREDVHRPHSLGDRIADATQNIPLDDFHLKYTKTETTDDGLITNNCSDTNKSKSSDQSLNLSYAKESRISKVFEEEQVGLLELNETCSESSVIGDESFIENLKEDLVTWMAALMEEYCEEWQNIMEETVKYKFFIFILGVDLYCCLIKLVNF